MKKTKVSAVEMIAAFSKKEDVRQLYTYPNKKEVRLADFSGLGRVWNDGMGFLQLCDFDDKNNLVVNSLLLSKSEIEDIKDAVKTPIIFVEYGYPDYYNHSLTSSYILENRKVTTL